MPKQPLNRTSYNEAFIDGQNLYMNTKANGWKVDPAKFRIYLAQKYHVKKAYYFLGCEDKTNRKLYRREPIDKIILVSGDGDYYRLVKFLRDENVGLLSLLSESNFYCNAQPTDA